MQLCMHIHRQGLDYAPVIDPETNSLVAILGYHDLGTAIDGTHLFTRSFGISDTMVHYVEAVEAQQEIRSLAIYLSIYLRIARRSLPL